MRPILFTLGAALILSACGRAEGPASMEPNQGGRGPGGPGAAPMVAVPDWMQQAKMAPGQACYLDIIEGARHGADGWSLPRTASTRAVGWAVDGSVVQQPDAYLELRNEAGASIYFKAVRSERPDVSDSPRFSETRPVNAGLTVPLELVTLAPGRYVLSLVVGDGPSAGRCAFEAETVLSIQ
ncbi:hypothetical protein PGKDCPLP_02897 [Stenotrophomonas maltophilia]|nr:hypothetical protein PGKDCPLP_02897 [Stenotrophomonas maltophilia]